MLFRSSLVRWTLEYEKLNVDDPESNTMLEFAIGVTKDIDAHLTHEYLGRKIIACVLISTMCLCKIKLLRALKTRASSFMGKISTICSHLWVPLELPQLPPAACYLYWIHEINNASYYIYY